MASEFWIGPKLEEGGKGRRMVRSNEGRGFEVDGEGRVGSGWEKRDGDLGKREVSSVRADARFVDVP